MSNEIARYKKKLEKAEKKVRILENMIENRTRKLYVTNIELERKNKELEQFTTIASHDLQEPLRTVLNFINLLDRQYKGKLGSEGNMYIEVIFKATTRMSTLIKGLLNHSLIGNRKGQTTIDCNILINDIKEDLSTRISETNTLLQVDELPKLKGYEIELRLLFQNLLTNAMKFCKKNVTPQIKISAKREDGAWLFSFQDNGIGIADNHKGKIFAIFQRLNSVSEYEGTGIGLAHCQKIINLHGGKIWLESELGKGSNFLFTIPIKYLTSINSVFYECLFPLYSL